MPSTSTIHTLERSRFIKPALPSGVPQPSGSRQGKLKLRLMRCCPAYLPVVSRALASFARCGFRGVFRELCGRDRFDEIAKGPPQGVGERNGKGGY